MIDVTGTVADIEKTFQLHLLVYNHPTEARTFFAPDTEPSADTTVPLLSIIGLDNYALPHPMGLHPSHPDGVTPQYGSGSGGTYLGYDFRHAYVPGTTLTGAGQTIALFELDGYTASDIAAYETAAGLPSVTLSMCSWMVTAAPPVRPTPRFRLISKWQSPWPRAFRASWYMRGFRAPSPKSRMS